VLGGALVGFGLLHFVRALTMPLDEFISLTNLQIMMIMGIIIVIGGGVMMYWGHKSGQKKITT